MWELGNLWAHDVGSSSTTPFATSSSYLSVMHEIHVLLVDHDTDSLVNTAKMLELCQYKVTLSELASGAIQTLSSGKLKFDLVMANVNSPDLLAFKLLQHAIGMEIPIILMSFDENLFMAMRAIETGAFLYMRKPVTMEMLKCLWQHIAREKIRLARDKEMLPADNNNNMSRCGIDKNPNNMFTINNMLMMDKDKFKKNSVNYSGREGDYDYQSGGNHMLSNRIKRKVCTEWTQELHEKFMDAVEQLGEGRCFPKEILELMDVPGLTRMQVASHLQKCRNDNWRSPEERKSNSSITQNASSDSDNIDPYKLRKFGSMPKISKSNSKEATTSAGGGTAGDVVSKALRSEVEIQNDAVERMEIERPDAVTSNYNNSDNNNNNNPYRPQYGSLAPNPGHILVPPVVVGTCIANPNPIRNTPEDHFFNFNDMDCLVQNYAGLPQVSVEMNNVIASSTVTGYHFEPVYRRYDQRTGSMWSSQSNFGSDDHDSAETRGQGN